jgi:hypothetical protein
MHTFVLQDWTTIRGFTGTNGQTIVQTERDWLDLSPFQDLFAWVDVREVTVGGGSVSLFLDTSPTEDENFFQSMTGATSVTGAALTPSLTPVVAKLPMLTATVPLARYLRWRLQNTSSTGAWDVTMRVVVAANSPGM